MPHGPIDHGPIDAKSVLIARKRIIETKVADFCWATQGDPGQWEIIVALRDKRDPTGMFDIWSNRGSPSHPAPYNNQWRVSKRRKTIVLDQLEDIKRDIIEKKQRIYLSRTFEEGMINYDNFKRLCRAPKKLSASQPDPVHRAAIIESDEETESESEIESEDDIIEPPVEECEYDRPQRPVPLCGDRMTQFVGACDLPDDFFERFDFQMLEEEQSGKDSALSPTELEFPPGFIVDYGIQDHVCEKRPADFGLRMMALAEGIKFSWGQSGNDPFRCDIENESRAIVDESIRGNTGGFHEKMRTLAGGLKFSWKREHKSMSAIAAEMQQLSLALN